MMSLFQKLTILIFCLAISPSIYGQSALQKAHSYALLDAPFLSIKYIQKHLRKHQQDKKAMLLLAESYQRVNMTEQCREWLLKANDCATPFDYYKKITGANTITKELQKKGIQLLQAKGKVLYNRIETENIAREETDQEELLAVLRVVTVVL
jgi:hypothetical protein